jgi:hypothetical protein
MLYNGKQKLLELPYTWNIPQIITTLSPALDPPVDLPRKVLGRETEMIVQLFLRGRMSERLHAATGMSVLCPSILFCRMPIH